MNGKVYLVGAGPGAADLLTLRAARLLGDADVVLHDALVSAEVLALATKAKLYNVGKRASRPSVDQRLICRLLVRMAQRHALVVRLKGGDPSLFGRATEELSACREASVTVEIVPGITAAFAAAATLNASLTRRGASRSVTFVTPSITRGRVEPDMHWADAAAAAETAIVYMGAQQAARVMEALLARGVPASRPVALLENVSLTNERVVRGGLGDLAVLAAELGEGPAIMMIGEAIVDVHTLLAEANAA